MGRGQGRAGLHPTALEFLADRRVAVLGSDGNNDTAPSTTEGVAFPVHVLAIQAMGLHLLDYLQFEDLVPRLRGGGPLVVPLRHRSPPAPGGHRFAGESDRRALTSGPDHRSPGPANHSNVGDAGAPAGGSRSENDRVSEVENGAPMSYPPIADHGLIGDLQTAALVATDGTVDWFCCPRFDSPSVFAVLARRRARAGGSPSPPVGDDYVTKQMYLPDTAVLVTRFLSEAGVAEVVDFMPIDDPGTATDRHRLVRGRPGVRGEVSFEVRIEPAVRLRPPVATPPRWTARRCGLPSRRR